MVDPIWIKAVLKALILPPTGPLLVALAGIALIRPRPRLGRFIATAAIGLLIALSLPVVGTLLIRTLYPATILDLAEARSAQAIVILGGGVRRDAVEYGGDTLGRLTLERVRYGAQVAKRLGLPVLVTGGSVLGDTAPEAQLMAEALRSEYGVNVQWSEPRSRTTHENAAYSAPILRAAGVGRIVLVAHGFDMPRAIKEFTREGLEVVPAPIGIPGKNRVAADFMPSMGGLQDSYYAIYEWTALLVYAIARGDE